MRPARSGRWHIARLSDARPCRAAFWEYATTSSRWWLGFLLHRRQKLVFSDRSTRLAGSRVQKPGKRGLIVRNRFVG